MLDVKKLLIKVLKHVTTQTGTDNGWTYYKYMDGTYDAYRKVQLTGLVLTSASAGTYYGNGSDHDYNYPSFSTGTIYGNAIATPSLSSGLFIYSVALMASGYRLSIRSWASNPNGSAGVMMHIRGTWNPGGVS